MEKLTTKPTEAPVLNGMRHKEIHDPLEYADKRVAVIGVGTIGSHLALTLGRMQVPTLLYDEDTIEPHNVATQSYTAQDVGRGKVETVIGQLEALSTPIVHEGIEMHYSGGPIDADILVSCVDSLEARKLIASQMVENGISIPIMDGRVGREQAEVYHFKNAAEWLAKLPEVADEDPCGARFTAYTALICAGYLANSVKRLLLGQSVPERVIYDAFTSTFIKRQEFAFVDGATALTPENVESQCEKQKIIISSTSAR